MELHEYQAKQLLRNRGIAVPPGDVAGNPSEARVIAENLRVAGFKGFFVKAQIHAGGRGFGFFPGSSLKSGVVHCETPAEVEHVASQMLGNNLVTSQTSAGGNKVSKVLVEAAIPCPHECYAAVMLDRNRECPVLLASGCGGQTVERDISASPRELIKEWVDPVIGACQYQARRIALALGFNGELLHPCATFLLNLYRTWWECEALIVEINPFTHITNPLGKPEFVALDAKMSLDNNALFRHPDLALLRDLSQEAPIETFARSQGLEYVKLDGDIACLVNGAGLAMATMDAIKNAGGTPANFLDVGGGASQEQIAAALRTILQEPNVRVILVNIFGGITDCAVVALGVATAIDESHIRIPVVIRIEGNNAALGRSILSERLPAVLTASSIEEAAEIAVRAARQPIQNRS